MSAEMTRRSINQLNKDMASLEKKSAELYKKEANARSNAARILKNIPNNASAMTIKSRQGQIDRYNNEAIKAAGDKADNDLKISRKKETLSVQIMKLQKEEATQKLKEEKVQRDIMQRYEKQIEELTLQATKDAPTNRQHLYSEQGDEEFDVFISHASEDKEVIAEPLYNALRERNIAAWYDNISIEWGDSLRAKIDRGLSKSKFGIIILSKDYINKGWTQYELDGLFQIEMTRGKVILPIWHNISKDEVLAFNPALAGRSALLTAMLSAEEIADKLVELLQETE